MQPWIKKHSPKKLSEIYGQDKVVTALKNYVETYKKQKKKALLLYGPTGTGKTSSVHALAKELDMELTELNASDVRNKDAIHSHAGNFFGQMSLFGKQKILLIDEIDGISGTKDRGGLPELLKLMEKSIFPVVMTANDIWNSKFSKLRKKCQVAEFSPLDYKAINQKLKQVCKQEKISYEESALQQLSREADGDMRAAINDLQLLTTEGILSDKEVQQHTQRQKKQDITEALLKIFKTKNPEIALSSLDNVEEDLEKVQLWIEENLPSEYKKTEDLSKAFNNLSMANIYFGRIRRRQHYRFYVYIKDLLTAGISLAKKEKYSGVTKYKQTGRILKMWIAKQRHMKKRAIAEKLAEKTHTSKKRAFQEVDYLRQQFQNKTSQKMIDYLDLNDEEVEWLRK